MEQLNIQNLEADSLVPYKNNARQHSPKQIQQIAKSIKQFGFLIPVLIDHNKMIIAGHGRIEAAKKLGIKIVPCIQVHHLSDAQRRAFTIADNRLTENSNWDTELLACEFEELRSLDLDFELETTGFEISEINMIIEDHFSLDQFDQEENDIMIDKNSNSIAKIGDLFALGRHRILCGDALDEKSYSIILKDEKVPLVLTDPPYNVRIHGHVSGRGKKKYREFAMASGEMSAEEFTTFLKTLFEHFCHFSSNGSLHFIFMDWRHMQEILFASHDAYEELKNLCVWVKDVAGMGSFYRSQHELCFIFKNGKGKHINNFELGQYGRYRTNVWKYSGANSLNFRSSDENEALKVHPTVKPKAMLSDILLDCSYKDALVLDPFLGSGSTLIACEQNQRRCLGIEIDPIYVDAAIRRWENFTGQKAIKIKM